VSLKSKMPLQVWILTLSAFAVGTAEFVIAGVLPQVADSLRVTEGQAGNPITAYALAIVVTGPILTLWLARALGGVIGGAVVDSSLGAGVIPFAAAVLPLVALVFILTQERGPGLGSAQTRVVADPTIL